MASGNEPVNSVRLNNQERTRMLDDLSRQSAASNVPAERRRFRANYTVEKITVWVQHPTGASTTYVVAPRNISTMGIGFLHGTYLYPTSPCKVSLETLDGERMQVNGTITNCRHVSRQVHEVGVRFDLPIDLRMFVHLNPEDSQTVRQEFQELRAQVRGVAEQDLELSGRVLIVDDMPADRKLLNFWLGKLGMSVVESDNTEDAYNRIRGGVFDLIIIDLQLGKESGLDVAMMIRESGQQTPIIMYSAEVTSEAQERGRSIGISGFLSKPLEQAQLTHLIKRSLTPGGDGSSGVIRSALASDPDMLPIIDEFVQGLSKYLDEIRSAMNEQDIENLHRICHQIKGAGGSYGFDVLSDAAQAALDCIRGDEPDWSQINGKVEQLNSMIARVSSQ